ncbi:MAG: hydantoinase B/oxoprolinase family protein [Hyphomonadaceae bacterium]|nr:hydantoinase B/oxoprolinase family protein [Hyphomonadaceae bacterium]MBC6413243.1 hydantoinase B/oxoprolinase family protein [Hyphomonadaceae bacterium]
MPSDLILNASGKHDPITVEIIQSSLTAITDEMFATMRKTAMSSIIYEVLDFGVAMFDADGNLASTGSGIPGFIGMLEPGVKAILNKFEGKDSFNDGDIFMTNMPHFGGVSHLNDVVLIMPVFHEGEIIGWLSNKAHWVDVGGTFPGSINPGALDVYQEGLQLPEIKVIEAGKPNQAVLDIIAMNTRIPETTMGDFWAGVASMRAGARRMRAIVEKYGRDVVTYAIQDYIDLGEKMARRALRELPSGVYAAEETLDDGRRVKVEITISDDAFEVDLRGNPDQTSTALNSSYDATIVDAQMIFKAIVDPQNFANSGTFKPINVLVDQGSMFAAEYPAATSVYYEVGMLLFDLLWKALAPSMKEYFPAGHYSSICGTFIGGPSRKGGDDHSIVEPQLGGWGACHDRDGLNALYTGYHGDTFNCPVEVTEQKNGLMVDRLELSGKPGGEGEYIGGKGIELDYRIVDDEWWLTMAYTRSENGPWGLQGGFSGSTNHVIVERANGEQKRYSECTALPLGKDDLIKVYTANGGGYGDPKNRPREKVLEDIRNGYVTRERAAEVYGVTV